MINKVTQIARVRGDARRNIAQASLMRVKVLGEDLGLLRKDAFSGDLSKNANIPAKDKRMLTRKLSELAPQGYGGGSLQMPGGAMPVNQTLGDNMLPGDALKLKLLKQMSVNQARKRRKGTVNQKPFQTQRSKRQAGAGKRGKVGYKRTGQSRSRDLGKQYKLLGNGINLPGGGKPAIMKFVMSKIIPSLMGTVGIPKGTLAISSIAKLISKALSMAKSGNLSQIISHLTKTILPILTAGKLKHLGMRGRGIGDMLKGHKNMLLSKLGKGMLRAFKWYINKSLKEEGLKPIFQGSGINLPGGSFANFWKGFKQGFKMVFKPGAKILGAAATALGQPEIGIPLGAVSGYV
jgi:hypothetical protein